MKVQKYFMRTRMHGTPTGRPDYKYFYDDLKPSQVGQRDLDFGVRSGCASGSAQITSLCVHWLRFVPPWLSQNVFVHFGPCDPEK